MSSPNWVRYHFSSCLLLGCLALWGGGCGEGSNLTPVKGKVTINGRPLTSGHVTFKPDKAKGNTFGEEPLGELDANGEYTLQVRGKPGAPPGVYKVVVASTGATTPDNTKPSTTSLINRIYLNADTTPLEKTVVANAPAGAYDLTLSP